MADSSLLAIQKKVRRITRSLSVSQLSDIQLNEYINTYILYDFPETLRLFNLKTTFTFYTSPYIDTYSTTSNTASPLYNFSNKYITTDSPVYIAGRNALFSQSREQFYGIYPLVNSIKNIGVTGDGTTTSFSGYINGAPGSASTQLMALLQKNVLFDSIDSNSNGLAMADSPILDSTTGNPTIFGQLYDALATQTPPTISLPAPYQYQAGITPPVFQPGFPANNYINYETGQFVVTFSVAPASGVTINSQTVPVNPAIPQAILFYDGSFVVRPVPDQSYRIDMEVWNQPTELLSLGQSPDLEEWSQLIAWNAAKKIFEDRMDYDSINMIMPSLKEQESLVLRRTIVQNTTQRASTIYSEQSRTGFNSGGFGGGQL